MAETPYSALPACAPYCPSLCLSTDMTRLLLMNANTDALAVLLVHVGLAQARPN